MKSSRDGRREEERETREVSQPLGQNGSIAEDEGPGEKISKRRLTPHPGSSERNLVRIADGGDSKGKIAEGEDERQTMTPSLDKALPHGQEDSALTKKNLSGHPVSTADKTRSRRVRFRRNSIIGQILSEINYESPSSEIEPKKAALKSFDGDTLTIDRAELKASSSLEYGEFEQSKQRQLEFLQDFGLSEVMLHKVFSKCSTMYHIRVLLDNGIYMKNEDSTRIEGEKKQASWIGLPDDKRLAKNSDYNLSVASCERYEALKDLSFFLIHLAATMALPTTFELFSCQGIERKAGGKGWGFRRVGTTPRGASEKHDAEDYIPLGDQVESAVEMIENFSSRIGFAPGGFLKLIEGVKTFCADERLLIEEQEGNILVIIITCQYPWGREVEEIPDRVEKEGKFVALLNNFADLPVTFVFLVECTEPHIIQFYDDLVSLENSVKADVKIAKGLGLMIEGVKKHNPWLNYCLPIHLVQTLGMGDNVLSQAASRRLSAHEVRVLCNTLIGDVPDPNEDKDAFLANIRGCMLNDVHKKWNPATGKYSPLIDTKKLKAHLSKRMPARLACLLLIAVAIVLYTVATIACHVSGAFCFGPVHKNIGTVSRTEL